MERIYNRIRRLLPAATNNKQTNNKQHPKKRNIQISFVELFCSCWNLEFVNRARVRRVSLLTPTKWLTPTGTDSHSAWLTQWLTHTSSHSHSDSLTQVVTHTQTDSPIQLSHWLTDLMTQGQEESSGGAPGHPPGTGDSSHWVYMWSDMEKDIFFYASKVWSKTILPEKVLKFWQKWICNKTALNVFDNGYAQNKTATQLKRQELCN